jgi:hypothetical protein
MSGATVIGDARTAGQLEAPMLTELLRSRGVPGSADDETLLAICREPSHKLAATLLSAWEMDGRELSAIMREELAEHRRRIARYEEAWALVASTAPAAYVVKGPTIAAYYPAGLIRAAGDLDVVCRDEPDLWAVTTRLIEQGWHLTALTVQRRAEQEVPGALNTLVRLQQPADGPLGLPYVVDLTTAEVATCMRTRAHRLGSSARSTLATSIITLVAERWERRFTSRDVLDLFLLERAATAEDRAALREGLGQCGLWPAYRELRHAVTRAGLGPGPGLGGSGHRDPRQSVSRLVERMMRWAHPVRVLGYLAGTTVDTDRGPHVDWIGRQVQERAGGRRLLALGLPMFGVPLGDRRTPGVLQLDEQGGHLVANTPAGSFLLVGAACRAEWLAQTAGQDQA